VGIGQLPKTGINNPPRNDLLIRIKTEISHLQRGCPVNGDITRLALILNASILQSYHLWDYQTDKFDNDINQECLIPVESFNTILEDIRKRGKISSQSPLIVVSCPTITTS
jgi:hypothetical protein